MAATRTATAEAVRNRPAGRLRAGRIASASPPDSRLAAGPPRTKTAARRRRRSRRAADMEAIPLVRAPGPQYQEIRPERSITTGPRRTERNRKPVESPPTTCPASWMQRAATTGARRGRTRERTRGPGQGMWQPLEEGDGDLPPQERGPPDRHVEPQADGEPDRRAQDHLLAGGPLVGRRHGSQTVQDGRRALERHGCGGFHAINPP